MNAPTIVHRTALRATALLGLAAVCLLGTVMLGTGEAMAADHDTTWNVRTASNSFGSDRANYSYAVNPGGEVHDGLVVTNPGTTTLHLDVYAADAFTTGAGQLDLLTEGATSQGVGAWTRAGRDTVTVQPGASVEVPFRIVVPDDAAPGDYMGGIVTSQPELGTDRDELARRVGIRIRLRVGGVLEPELTVEDLHVDYAGTANPFAKGEATVTWTIRNTGNAILAARPSVTVSGPFGRGKVMGDEIADTPVPWTFVLLLAVLGALLVVGKRLGLRRRPRPQAAAATASAEPRTLTGSARSGR